MNSYIQCIRTAKQHVDFGNDPITVFDIGCNINSIQPKDGGGFLDDFTAIALNNFSDVHRVYAYEPVHWQRYDTLYREQSGKVILVKKAVSNHTNPMMFFSLDKSHGLSSAFNRPNFIKHSGVQQITVNTTTVDHEMDRLNLDRIDYLKVDTEGSELNVLKGSHHSLKNKLISCIQLEHGGTYQDAGYSKQVIQSLVESYGYVLRLENPTELLYTV